MSVIAKWDGSKEQAKRGESVDGGRPGTLERIDQHRSAGEQRHAEPSVADAVDSS